MTENPFLTVNPPFALQSTPIYVPPLDEESRPGHRPGNLH